MVSSMIGRLLAAATAFAAGAAGAATVYTGDTLQGMPVISQLDVADLAPGKVHRLMFRSAETSIGQYWYVPVMVAKGAQPGKRVLLVAGVHGDELNPIAAVQQTMTSLDPAKMKGTVIGIMGASTPGLQGITRTWMINDLGGAQINPNRTWPGRETGNTVERHSWLITNKIIKGNIDAAVDHHTGGTGTDFAKFIFVYAASPESVTLAKLFPDRPDHARSGLSGDAGIFAGKGRHSGDDDRAWRRARLSSRDGEDGRRRRSQCAGALWHHRRAAAADVGRCRGVHRR